MSPVPPEVGPHGADLAAVPGTLGHAYPALAAGVALLARLAGMTPDAARALFGALDAEALATGYHAATHARAVVDEVVRPAVNHEVATRFFRGAESGNAVLDAARAHPYAEAFDAGDRAEVRSHTLAYTTQAEWLEGIRQREADLDAAQADARAERERYVRAARALNQAARAKVQHVPRAALAAASLLPGARRVA